MPGMMDTILNLGLNDTTVEALKARTRTAASPTTATAGSSRCSATSCLEIGKDEFEHELTAVKTGARRRPRSRSRRGAPSARSSTRYKGVVRKHAKQDFPQDPLEQLRLSRDAVFRSWQNPRAKEYRRIYAIPDHIGTAVNVQAMVFGNTGDRSGTGVGFTRNPATGAKEFYGEFLINAQGEDVVAGIRTPRPISRPRDA